MKSQVWLGQNSFRFWYYRYKDSPYYHLVVICFLVFLAFFLFVKVIVPQVSSWFSLRDEVIATNDKLATLRSNINLVNNLDKNLLENQVETATAALPPQQDFSAILAALNHAATTSNVALNDFSFQIGDAATRGTNTLGGVKVVPMIISISGAVKNVQKFMQILTQELPVSNIAKIGYSGQTATVTIEFYQKPFPKTSFNPESPIIPLSDNKNSLLQKLSNWQQATSGQQNLSIPVSSGSGVPLF
jgi:hypothetical protein